MANRQLSPEELERANALLSDIRKKLEALSRGDTELLFAYRRKVFKELTYDERSKPMVRRKFEGPEVERAAGQVCDLR
jgi:UTP:GlnB (protein PII) uridylyltransferase